MLKQKIDQRGVPGGARRVQRGDPQGIARGLVRVGAGIEQQGRNVAVAEEGGEAEAGETVAGVLLRELAIGGEEFGYTGGGAQRSGFEEVG